MAETAQQSDAQLVVGIGRYEEGALAEVYRRHAGPVLGLARRLLVDDQAAEDVAQDVFVSLWRQPDRFDPQRGSLRSYLLTLAHGRAVDVARSSSARRRREERQTREAATGGYDLEHEVWDLHLAAQVREALAELSATERRAIELAYFGGRTYREVAQLLEEPEGTIKSRIRTGLQRIRASLVASGAIR
jgi:RNA polymerase sigma-70 factor, ECF subfamily